MKNEQKRRNFFIGFLKVFCVSLLFWGAILGTYGWQKLQNQKRISDVRFSLKKIAVRSRTVDKVPVCLLASLFPVKKGDPLFSIDPKVVKERILSCPSFYDARVWRLLPGTLGVEYTLRSPIGSLAGFRNVCFDAHGVLFFLVPYFPPKKLPKIVLPLEKVDSLDELQRKMNLSREKDMVLQLLPLVSSVANLYKMNVESIDFSSKNHPNIFRREIILVFSHSLGKKGEYVYVRCNGTVFSVKRLKSVFSYVFASGFEQGVIDMRFPSCVLVKRGGKE